MSIKKLDDVSPDSGSRQDVFTDVPQPEVATGDLVLEPMVLDRGTPKRRVRPVDVRDSIQLRREAAIADIRL